MEIILASIILHNIVYSEFKNGNWTTPKTLAKNLNCITDINVGAIIISFM